MRNGILCSIFFLLYELVYLCDDKSSVYLYKQVCGQVCVVYSDGDICYYVYIYLYLIFLKNYLYFKFIDKGFINY